MSGRLASALAPTRSSASSISRRSAALAPGERLFGLGQDNHNNGRLDRRGVLRELLEESLRFGFSEYGDFFNRAGIEQLNARHQARRTNAGYHLWGLLMLMLWMKEWHVRIPATAQ